jgi:hypothetical protein
MLIAKNAQRIVLVITVAAITGFGNAASVLAETRDFQGGRMPAGILEVRHITVSIERAPQEVYAFIADGHNLAQWATGLGTRFERDGDQWLAQGPLGKARVRIATPNDLGVADQTVTLESGATVHNPIRVVPNGKGSTVTFTLLRQPNVSEDKFNSDANWVQKDLNTLKTILEKR